MSSFIFEPSGQMKIPTTEDLAIADEDNGILVLSRGVQADGTPYYAYIVVIPSKFAEFMRKTEEKIACDLESYGDVLFAESLAEPPVEIAEMMRDCYDFDEEFQQKLFEEMKKEQKVFVGKKEEKRIMDIVAMMKKQKPAGSA